MSASPRADEQALCGKRRPARALPLFVWSPDEAAALEVGRSIADSEGWTCLDGINLGSLASQLRALFDHVGDRQERDGSDVFDVVLDSVLQVAGTYWDANESTAVVVCPATDASEHPKVLLNACPMARVICVHRSCSGSIESLLERNRLGFQSVVVREYVKAHAGNLVHALALYWADVTERLLQLEHEEASRCCRCSYEGFRAEKESVASEIRKFVRGENAVLSVAPPAAAVAITASTLPMERVGPNVRRRIDRLNQLIGYDALDDDYCRHVDALLRTDILVSGVRVKLPGLGSGCEVASSAEIGDVDLVRGKLPDGLVAVVEAIVRRLDGSSPEMMAVGIGRLAVALAGTKKQWIVDLVREEGRAALGDRVGVDCVLTIRACDLLDAVSGPRTLLEILRAGRARLSVRRDGVVEHLGPRDRGAQLLSDLVRLEVGT